MPTACDCDKPGDPTAVPPVPGDQNPLCQENASGAFGKTQYRAKAYPGVRELQVLKGVGNQGIVASICPAQQTDVQAKDYGYRPAIGTIIERLKEALGGKCLPRSFSGQGDEVPCLILEASTNSPCDCSTAGKQPVSEQHKVAEEAAKLDPLNPGWTCFCEIQQLTVETGLEQCLNSETEPQNVHGWCYVDPAAGKGSWDVVKDCPETQKRIIRMVGEGQGATGATLFITCTGETQSSE